jgi:hypothetical protein
MTSRIFDSGKASTSKGEIQWKCHAIFGLACALIIGIFAWSAEPSFLESNNPNHAEDTEQLSAGTCTKKLGLDAGDLAGASVRNGDKAVALAEQVNQLSKDKDPRILRTLAAAYAEAGRFPEAVLTAEQALTLAVAKSNTGLTNVLQTEIGLYQRNSPCRSINE